MKRARVMLYAGSRVLGTPVGTSGELILESDSLRFVSSSFYIRSGEIDLPLREVQAVRKEPIKLGFGVSVDGFSLVCCGQRYLFRARSAGHWVKMIQQATTALENLPAKVEIPALQEIPGTPPETDSTTGARETQAAEGPTATWGAAILGLMCAGYGLFAAFIGFMAVKGIDLVTRGGAFSFSPEIEFALYEVFVGHSAFWIVSSVLAGVVTAVACYAYFAYPRFGRQREATRQQRRDKKAPGGDALGRMIWGLIIVLIGVAVLGVNLGIFSWLTVGSVRTIDVHLPEGRGLVTLPWLELGNVWAPIFIGAGLLFLLEVVIRVVIPTYRRPARGRLILAFILLLIGAGGYIGWELTWPLIPVAVGLAITIGAFLRPKF